MDSSLVVAKGFCCYITTGAPLPKGSDAVVMIEDTEVGDPGGLSTSGKGERVMRVRGGEGKAVKTMAAGTNVRQVGSDIALGEVVLTKGKLLDAGDVGILASLGVPSIKVCSKPSAGFMSTVRLPPSQQSPL